MHHKFPTLLAKLSGPRSACFLMVKQEELEVTERNDIATPGIDYDCVGRRRRAITAESLLGHTDQKPGAVQ